MLIKGKKGDVELSLKTIVGIVIGIGGLIIFAIIAIGILKLFVASNQCEPSLEFLELIKINVDRVSSSGDGESQLISIKNNCVLVGFSKYTSSLVKKPEVCQLSSCLCLCEYGITNPGNRISFKCINKNDYCASFDSVEGFIGQFSSGELKDQVIISGNEIVNINKFDKFINMTVDGEYKFKDVIFSG